MKYLVIVLVVAVLVWLARSGRRRVERQGSGARRETASGAEPMVSCAHCGLHLPRSDALVADGAYYCDEAHREAHARKDAAH